MYTCTRCLDAGVVFSLRGPVDRIRYSMKSDRLGQIVVVAAIVLLYTTLLHVFSSSRAGQKLASVNSGKKSLTNGNAFRHNGVTTAGGADLARLETVVEMTRHTWSGYMRYAAPADELRPVTNSSTNKWGGIGVTPIDSLDTLLLMGLHDEFLEAVDLVKQIDMRRGTRHVSVFETIIRHVGGALSAYAATNNSDLLQVAVTVADGLLQAFDGPLHLPAHNTRFGGGKEDNTLLTDRYMLAEVGSFQMEFRYLSSVTGNPRYAELADTANRFFIDLPQKGWPSNPRLYESEQPIMPNRGLFPTFITTSGKFYGAAGVASMMDSFYEYILKQWIQFGKKDAELLELYEDAVESIILHLVRYTPNTNIAVLGYHGHTYHATMDHLSCFVPGMLVLGVMHGAHDYVGRSASRMFDNDDIIEVAMDLAATCYRFYAESPCGLSPDVVEFDLNGTIAVRMPKHILRPEAIESFFYLYRYTKDERYREWGWSIVEALNKHSRTAAGFSALNDTRSTHPHKSDSMESFFIAETLKYLYLLFSDDSVLPLDRWVLTTEAHPLPIVKSRP